jgi:RHS repeat-associated protein
MSERVGTGRWLGSRGIVAAGLAALLVAGGATTAFAATMPTGPSTTGLTGQRTSATRLSFPISDQVSASVDVGTGNVNVAGTLLKLQGVQGQVPVGVAYNSRDTTGISGATSSMKGPFTGWTWNLAGAGSLSMAPNGSTIDYTTADGAVWPFTQSNGIFTSPAGLKAALKRNSDTSYTLTALDSSQVINFDSSGNPTSVADRNGSTSTITPWSSGSMTVTGTAGPSAARTATLAFVSSTTGGYATYQTTVSQSNGSASKTASLTQTSAGQPTALTDAIGARTTFAYSSGLLSQITNPMGATTSFTYDSSNRVTQVSQSNSTSGAAGTSITRFSYASATSTLVADPDTSTSTAVASGAHTTYTLDSNDLVTKAVDAAGRTRSKTYTSQGLDTASSTTGTTGGSPASVSTTYAHDSSVNGGQSLTGATSQGGNASTATYGNTSASSQYLPTATASDTNTASSSTSTSYTYNGVGNQLTSTGNTTTGSDASSTAVTSTVTRNSDGTIASATAPGNSGNSTQYQYGDHQLVKVIPVSGSSLGTTLYTYDALGRLRIVTDGANRSTTYTYDNDDRVLTTAFSDGTGTVTNTWDAAGHLTRQVSDGGTITNTYDQLGQLLSTANTSSGGTISYGYDKAGNNTSLTDSRGTTTQAYDASGVLLSTTYPKASSTSTTYFKTDDNGNRTDEWLQSNATQSAWAAHTHTTFDASGRISRIFAQKGPASGPTTQMDVYYCYNTGGSGTNCGTASGTDMSKLQWTYNNLTGQTTKFTYDGTGRLTRVAESGGSDTNNTYAYTYDANGNRLTANVTGSTSSTQTLTYNAANQITSTGYSYDGAGNMTASPTGTYTYNAAEQMTQAVVGGTTSTYTYAGSAQNAVLRETIGSSTTYKVAYGRTDQVGNPTIAQYGVGSLTAYVESDPVTGQATMLHTSSDIAALYVYDGLGSPVALLTDFSSTSFQYKYDPYGLPTLQASSGGNGVGQNPYAFKSGIQDRATGFVKFGQRWYNPSTGTWTQQDTLDSPLDPTNANRYAYAGGDPVNGVDPSGASVTNDIAGGLLGFATTALCTAATVGAGTVACAAAGFVVGTGYAYALDSTEGEDISLT